MKKMSPEEIALIGTSIAVNLCKDKDEEELECIKNIANQVCCTIGNMISQKCLCNKYNHKKF